MNNETLIKELTFTAVRSSGAGGQHVNKVSSKIVLQFYLAKTEALTIAEKQLALEVLEKKLTKDNVLIVTCETSRSQHKNKEIAIDKFLKIMETALHVKKARKATKPSKRANRKRLEKKAKHALKKVNRKKFNY